MVTILLQSEEFFTFELASRPHSLFTEEGMRKGTYAFSPLTEVDVLTENRSEVIDGGWLLHTVVWIKQWKIQQIRHQYVEYIKNNFSTNAFIALVGYPEVSEIRGTKSAERLMSLSLKHRAIDFVFNENSIPSMSQQKFIANDNNKQNFILLLLHHFHNSGISAMAAEEDADIIIVQSALSNFFFNDSVYIIENDIDLLVLLTGLCADNITNVYLRKPKQD